MAGKDLTMKKQFKNLFTKRGLLFRRVRDGEQEIQQLGLPLCYKQDVLKGLHDEVGHPGIERTTSTDVEAWVSALSPHEE